MRKYADTMVFRQARFGRAVTLGVLAVSVALVTPVLGFAAPAQAHNYLIASTPEVGSTISELPEEFSVTTNEALLDISGDGSGFAVQVTDAAGLFYGDGCVTVEGSTMSTPAALGEAGSYFVTWQIISADGHPISDEFRFDWQPADGAVLSEGSTSVPDCGGTIDTGAGTDGSGTADETTESVDAVTAAATEAATLSNVLWVGGILAAIIVGVLVTLAVLGRKPRAGSGSPPPA